MMMVMPGSFSGNIRNESSQSQWIVEHDSMLQQSGLVRYVPHDGSITSSLPLTPNPLLLLTRRK